MKTNLRRPICLFLLAMSTVINLSAQDSKAGKQIDFLMNQEYKLGLFNGNVLVIKDGRTVYQSGFGYAAADKKTKLTSAYRFNIGSIGKEFNAVGIMMLKEQGKLSLDNKVSKFLPDLPAWADKISIKNLLQYTSGLPDLHWETIKSDADILNDLKALKQLDSEPGTKYAYNNNNIFVQRRIIEKISGMTFQKFVETKMLQPCKMTESVVDSDLSGKNIAVSFNNDLVPDPRQFTYVMSGWVSVTTQDLYKWAQCLNAFSLIDQSSYKELLTPFQPGRQAGLGSGSLEDGKITFHRHDGQSLDFEALVYDQPAEHITVILLTNNKNFKLNEIRDSINAILHGAEFRIPKKSVAVMLEKKGKNLSGDQLIELYNEMKSKSPDEYNFDNESELNDLGYSLMSDNRIDDAIKIFELNVRTFPKSGNAYDSLGEAYLSKDDKKSALLNYKKSLELDPQNQNARDMIAKLEQQ